VNVISYRIFLGLYDPGYCTDFILKELFFFGMIYISRNVRKISYFLCRMAPNKEMLCRHYFSTSEYDIRKILKKSGKAEIEWNM
jgi:hypothetical protein